MPSHLTPQQEFRKMLKEEFDLNEYRSKKIANLLMELARRYHRIQENWCNISYTDDERRVIERREARLENQITDILTPYLKNGKLIGILFEGDPRGYEIKLKLKSGRYNNWGGEAFGIPSISEEE